jgi:hypothetical protein
MANTISPFGALDFMHQGGSQRTEELAVRWITSSDVTPIFYGDLVQALFPTSTGIASAPAYGTYGIAAVRVPLSGAAGGRIAGDIVLPLMGRDLCVEVKARADGFRELYYWLNERDVLIVKADHREPLVVVRLSLAAEVAKAPT